jgi:transposase
LTFLPQADDDALQAARERQETPAFTETDALRAGIERMLNQAIRVGDLRHCRYLGLATMRLPQVGIAAALNFIRLIAWLSEIPRAPTRVTPVACVRAQT